MPPSTRESSGEPPHESSPPSVETPAQTPETVEEADFVEETSSPTLDAVELRNCTTAVWHELYPCMIILWLSLHSRRVFSGYLERLWLPCIVDKAYSIPSANGDVWRRPLDAPPPLLGQCRADSDYEPDLPLKDSCYTPIVNCLFLNPFVARFFQAITDYYTQHQQFSNVVALRTQRYLSRSNASFARNNMLWWSVLPFERPLVPYKDSVLVLIQQESLELRRRLRSLQGQNPPNQVPGVASANPTSVLLGPEPPIVMMADERNEEVIQSAWRSLRHFQRRTLDAFLRIIENGEAIRSELRVGLANLTRDADLLQLPQDHQRAAIDGGLNERNSRQIRGSPREAHVNDEQQANGPTPERPSLPTNAQHLSRRMAVSAQGRTQSIQRPREASQQQQQPVIPTSNPLLQGPTLRPLGENQSHVLQRTVNLAQQRTPIFSPLRLSHWERIGRLGKKQTTYGEAILELNHRIENIQILQTELSQIYDNVHPRSETRVTRLMRCMQTLLSDEFQRSHGRRANVAPYHIEMHKFSLRESVVVEERRLRTKAQTMEKMNRLEIWLQVLRSDFTTAARVHGPDEQIKRTWGFPPWPVEMESLGAGRVQRNWVGSP